MIRTRILLSCGHWTEGGSDPLWWLQAKHLRTDVQCHRVHAEPQEAIVQMVLVSVSDDPWREAGEWIK